MSPQELTQVAQDYIKIVWSLQEWSKAEVTTKDLAERLGVGASTVSETVRRLAAQGLLEHQRYGAITLTELGRRNAVAMVRRHRLLETFLVYELGYTWDEVHDEAEVLEHAVSDLLVDRIDARLNFPDRDPHGDPIPHKDGTITSPQASPLAVLEEDTRGQVSRISDEDPEVLRYLGDLGFGLDAHVHVTARKNALGTIDIDWYPHDHPTKQTRLTIGLRAAHAIWIVTT